MMNYSVSKDGRLGVFAALTLLSFVIATFLCEIINSLITLTSLTNILVQLIGFGSINGLIISLLYRPLLYLSRVPYIGGEYKGCLCSSFDKSRQIDVSVIIVQRFFKMEITLTTEHSCSENTATHIDNQNSLVKLQYMYRNEPRHYDDLNLHDGACELTFSGSEVFGKYYTDPKRNNHGNMLLKRK